MTCEYDLPFGRYELHDRYVICVPGLEADIREEDLDLLAELASQHYTRPFGHISNRVHSNSVNPLIYPNMEQAIPNLATFAIVTYGLYSARAVQVERFFFRRVKFEVFDSLPAAIEWTLLRLDELDK